MSENEKAKRLKVSAPERQSIRPGTGPTVKDIHAERTPLRAQVDTQRVIRQYREPTVAVHGVTKTYDTKPLSTMKGKDVARVKKEG